MNKVNTKEKTLVGENMDDQMQVRIDSETKEKFKAIAEKMNPALPKNRAASMVIRQLMLNYIEENNKDRR